MSEKEKLENLDDIQRRLAKVRMKLYKLSKELEKTDEYDSDFDKTKYARKSMDDAIEWLTKEMGYQRKKVLNED